MTARVRLGFLAAFVTAAFLLAAGSASAATASWWHFSSRATPSNLKRGGEAVIVVQAIDLGNAPATGPMTVSDTLPAGLTPQGVEFFAPNTVFGDIFDLGPSGFLSGFELCQTTASSASCSLPQSFFEEHAGEGPLAQPLVPYERLEMRLHVAVDPGASSGLNQLNVTGGGALPVSVQRPLTVSGEPVPFGLETFAVSPEEEGGTPATHAGSHPYQLSGDIAFSSTDAGTLRPPALPRNLHFNLPAGQLGNPTIAPHCSTLDFNTYVGEGANKCPGDTAIGAAMVTIAVNQGTINPYLVVPVFNLTPALGEPARFGFEVAQDPVVLDTALRSGKGQDYGVTVSANNITQVAAFLSGTITLWGTPGDPSHDASRGWGCIKGGYFSKPSGQACTPSTQPKPPAFLTSPANCAAPYATTVEGNSWPSKANPQGVGLKPLTYPLQDEAGSPLALTGCNQLPFAPKIESKASADSGETGSGLDFSVDFPNEGLLNAEGLSESPTNKAIIALPEGLTINPSVGEGLGVCTTADYERETIDSAPGEGCPNASKLGTLEATSPLIEEAVKGSVYLAQQDDKATPVPGAENPFDSLIALYLVLKNQKLGISVKLPLKVEPDPKTGQLVATLEDVPQIPISHFNFHFREGARAPLITPAACGTYTAKAKFYPWSDPQTPTEVSSSFKVTRGVGGGPCPSGGLPPFHPHFEAGALNNNAGSFSPFTMRLIRQDGEQDMTKFSAILPPGELGSLAGVAKCPDSAIATARAKTGRQELQSPSCPANSLIGHTLAGAGVGEALTYVGGQIYLGGPFRGDPLSVIAITPAVAGPFDAGTVVVQLALTLNPKTAEVEVDGANSEPIPHILDGIVLKIRDLRVSVDRPSFTLNPTNCEEEKANATLFGSYLNVFDPTDDVPVGLSSRYQAANCAALGFKPKLALNLKGGTKRGGHPGLRAIYTPKKGDANIKGLVVRLPRSAFLDQAHIKTICTRVQFAAKACPERSQYGYIKAWTPLLDTPLEGPVYLRSSNHKLPDLVFDLHGLVDIEVSVRIDSAHGGIRATLENSPDAPLSKVDLRMQGAKKGLIINSRNLCSSTNRANVEFTGQNGKEFAANPVMKPDCGGGRKHKRHHAG